MHFVKSLHNENAFSWQTVASVLVGIVIGAITSFIVNATLIEISLNSFFSLYYGILFSFIGGFIFYRIKEGEENGNSESEIDMKKPIIKFFAGLTIASGIISILLDKNWFHGLSPLMKVPLYIILGSSVCFALIFAIVDLINFVGGVFRRIQYRSLVDTPHQIIALSAIALIMGGIYGMIFGFMDVEDATGVTLQQKMYTEERYCFAIGTVLGGAGGFLNEIIRRNIATHLFMKVEKDPFCEEI